jgi:mono/diheme cytochrome c family protein
MKRPVWIAVGAGVLAAVALGAWLLWPREVRIDAENTKAVALGAQLYARHCASCHGKTLEGQPEWQSRNPQGRLPAPPHDENGHTWHHDDQVLFEVTKYGLARYAPPGYQSDMPAFEGTLSDPEIVAVLAFVKSRWPVLIRDKRREAGMN